MTSKAEELRKLLFPAIAIDMITGYNIYQEPATPSDAKFRVSYLHSNLKEEDEHRKQLEQKVNEFGISIVLKPQRCQRVDRTAAYRLEQGWQADEYYDAKGNKVPEDAVDQFIKRGMPIIGVSKQYDLRIGINDRKTLDALLEIFRKHTNAYLINKKTGKIVTYSKGEERRSRENRKHRIIDAWEVPFISVDTGEQVLLPGYQRVKRISLNGFGSDVSSLIDKKWDGNIVEPETGTRYPTFRAYLEYAGIRATIADTAINKVLADWINKVDWEKLRQARQVIRPDTFK